MMNLHWQLKYQNCYKFHPKYHHLLVKAFVVLLILPSVSVFTFIYIYLNWATGKKGKYKASCGCSERFVVQRWLLWVSVWNWISALVARIPFEVWLEIAKQSWDFNVVWIWFEYKEIFAFKALEVGTTECECYCKMFISSRWEIFLFYIHFIERKYIELRNPTLLQKRKKIQDFVLRNLNML